MLVVIGHDAFPHHHLELDEIEAVTSLPADHRCHDGTKEEHENKQSFPPHQHIFAPEDLIAGRNNVSFQKEIKFSVTNAIFISSLICLINSEAFENQIFRIINIPRNPYPFIISPNAMRGSPVNA